MLSDVLKNNLKIVFCGTAAGKKSAEISQYYAGRGNKFWETLYKVRLTSEQLEPSRYQELVNYGLGLTDVVKGQSGMDHEIDFKASDSNSFAAKIIKYSPKILCFNGKQGAKVNFSIKNVDYGIYREKIGETICFVAPSTSGAANKNWDIKYWEQLASLVLNN